MPTAYEEFDMGEGRTETYGIVKSIGKMNYNTKFSPPKVVGSWTIFHVKLA